MMWRYCISAASRQWMLYTVFALFIMPCATVSAEQLDKTNHQLLDESEYRTGLEEIVIIGKRPRWKEGEQKQWRPERFELSQDIAAPRMQWFPEYSKDERENYQGVRDRTGEKAEIKFFELKF
jgi:hypothetical protein